jgi:hypothetical protein
VVLGVGQERLGLSYFFMQTRRLFPPIRIHIHFVTAHPRDVMRPRTGTQMPRSGRRVHRSFSLPPFEDVICGWDHLAFFQNHRRRVIFAYGRVVSALSPESTLWPFNMGLENMNEHLPTPPPSSPPPPPPPPSTGNGLVPLVCC